MSAHPTDVIVGYVGDADALTRNKVLRRIVEVMAPIVRLKLSVRQGPGAPWRPGFDSYPDHIVTGWQDAGLTLIHRAENPLQFPVNKPAALVWTWLIFGRISIF